ncbi:MAG TPA: hypothetical protein ENN77_00940, partial [Candidatus Wirthbacteria bacterium]|nr:hypothetical protein [Candidatus Wirthbacteria bacterium]
MPAKSRKKTTRRKKIAPARRRSTTRQRRSKKDQERLLRELASVLFFTFGLISLVVMYKQPAEAGYALRQFLIGAFGLGGWLVSLVSFYIGFALLFPPQKKRRVYKIFWSIVLTVMILGLLETSFWNQTATFDPSLTRGGIIGFGLNQLLGSLLGKLIAIL